ncbi:hypothetical protein DH2020_022530 [Rehmannia glutinosa]|uniref:Uncharacterized protein n=1 Tax=Rehmannia glutinosa TaxID=99300 RepID=A0ABR0WHU2_REHGL
MEKELTELFESVKRAAEVAENSPGEEDRCLDALKRLKKFPVGKRVRQLTKHKSNKIKALASDVIGIWKTIIVKETMQNKKNEDVDNDDFVKTKPAVAETNVVNNIQRINSFKTDQKSRTNPFATPNSDKALKSETFSSVEIEKVQKIEGRKLNSLIYCNDPTRDKVREILAEALSKVCNEVDDDLLKDKANGRDPYHVAVSVETAMFEKWGKSSGAHKVKYRSILFNIKDSNNPDFRRKVLLGDIEPHAVLDLTAEEMAAARRSRSEEKLKQKSLFNSERGGTPQASTDQFTCGRCKKKETTYYQMQTRKEESKFEVIARHERRQEESQESSQRRDDDSSRRSKRNAGCGSEGL